MASMTLLPRGRPFTREDLDAMPDDGNRYELIDGALIVTPSPRFRHQDVVGELHVLLKRSVPAGLIVILAPFDVALAEDTVVQPDLIVCRRDDVTDRDLPTAPVLAIEVLSPSTRGIDLTLKRARYERAGVSAYWTVDPVGPELTAFELVDGLFVETARVSGDEAWHTETPFPVELVPSALRDPSLDWW